VNLHASLTEHAVWGQVLAFEVDVDRHVMSRAASTDGWDEIDGDHATLPLDEVGGVVRNEELHGHLTLILRSLLGKPRQAGFAFPSPTGSVLNGGHRRSHRRL